jgi:ComF family protein
MNIFEDFIALIYPQLCQACGNALYKHEKIVCNYCLVSLPKTNFHFDFDNPISKIFWGRVNVNAASAYLYFNKGNRVQKLLHQLKYKNKAEVGFFLGQQYGLELRSANNFAESHYVIPVPLHPKKLLMRGYNQSESIANGIAESLNIPALNHALIRTTASETQTKKSRFARWENVASIFEVKNQELLVGKTVIIVDDVLTTGATLEACINELLKVQNIKVNVLAIAYANH